MQVTYNATVGIRNAANLVKMASATEYANYYQAANGSSPNAGQGNASTDWFGEVLQTAWQHNHNVTISGGSEKNNYYLSLGYLDDEGIVKTTGARRYSVRLNEDYKFTKWLKAGVEANFTSFNIRDLDLTRREHGHGAADPLLQMQHLVVEGADVVGDHRAVLDQPSDHHRHQRLDET